MNITHAPSLPILSNPVLAAPAIDPSRNRIEITVPNGMTIMQIIETSFPDYKLFSRERIRVALVTKRGSMIIAAEHWDHVRPKAGVHIVIRLVPGKGALRGILQIVVSIAAVALGQLWAPLLVNAFGISSQLAAGIIGLGVSAIGNMLINALIPAQSNSGEKPKPVYMISGWRNQFSPDGIVPAVLGRHRFAPPLGATGYTEIVGDLQYARGLFCFGHGALQIEDIRIGETPISKFDEVEMEIRQGLPDDEPLTIYPSQIIEEQFGVELRRDLPRDDEGEVIDGQPVEETPVERFGATDAEEMAVIIGFPAGLIRINDKGKARSLNVKIRIRQRRIGTTAWLDVTELNINAKKREAFYRVHRWKLPSRGRYEIQVTRMTEERTGMQETDRVVLVSLQSFRPEYPLNIDKPMALIAMRIKATHQLNSALDNVNAIVTRIAPDWDAASKTWITRPTRNPASLYRWVLQSELAAISEPDENINLEALADWHEMCEAKGLKYDRIHDFEASFYDTLSLIAAAGRASPHHDGRQWNVVIDRPREIVVDQINARNSRSFRWNRNYIQPPHAFRVSFLDETNSYQSSERLVPWPGYNGDITITEQLELPGKTDPAEIWREARRRQYEIIHRPDSFTAIQDGAARVATRGDLVMGAWDVLDNMQVAARVVAVRNNHIEIDDEVEMIADQIYAISYRDPSAPIDAITSNIIRTLATIPGRTRGLVLKSDSQSPKPVIGSIVHFGTAGKESIPLIVAGTEAGEDMSTVLSMLPASPIIDTLTDAEVPPLWDGRVGIDYGAGMAKPTQPIYRAILTGMEGTDDPDMVEVMLQPGSGSTAIISSFNVRHRLVGDSTWRIDTASVANGSVMIKSYIHGNQIELQSQSVSNSGVVSDWTGTVTIMIGGRDLALPAALPLDGVDINGGAGFISVMFVTSTDIVTSQVQVYRNMNGTLNRDTDKAGAVMLVEPQSSFARLDGDATRVNLIKNPTFNTDTEWTKGTGWSIASDKASHAAGSASGLSQVISGLQAGRTYRYQFTVADRTAGLINAQLDGGGTTAADTATSENAALRGKLVANASNTRLTLWANSTFNGSVKSVQMYLETPACLPQGTHYVWLEPQNAEGVPGPVSGPFIVTIT